MAAAKKHKINFGGVDEEIRKHTEKGVRVPEGDYVVKVVKGEFKENEDKGTSGFNWRCQILKPEKYKGKTVYGYTSLKTEALWNLRNLINAALGKNVAGKKVEFDPSKLEGKIVGASIEDDEYKGKVKSRIATFFPKVEAQLSEGDEDEDDDEDEEDTEDEDDDESEDDDEDLDEVDVEEI